MNKLIYPTGTVLYAPKRLPLELRFNPDFIDIFNEKLSGKQVVVERDYYGGEREDMKLCESHIWIASNHIYLFKKNPLNKKIEKILKI